MQTVRTQYDQARFNQATQAKTAVAASLRAYLATLEPLEKRLTQKGDIEGALATRKERAAAAEQLAAVAVAVPEMKFRNSPTTTAKTLPAANPAAVSTPPSTAGNAAGAPVIEVTGEIKSYAYITTPWKNAFGFTTPPGGPVQARGGRGVLLKNESTTAAGDDLDLQRLPKAAGERRADRASTRQRADRHLIRAEGLFVVSPEEFSKTPWEGGDPTPIIPTAAAAGIFPLKAKTYKVTSQLSGAGKYVISIDGTVVGTANFVAGPSLSLGSNFKGILGWTFH